MNKTSPFFISDEDEFLDEPKDPSYTRQLFKMPDTSLIRPKIPSKYIRKWSEYVDETAIQKCVDPTNGDIKFSLPIARVNLTPLLKINVDLNYVANKDGVYYSIPLTINFISANYHKSVFRNDATFLMNSMGYKMQLERVELNKLKMTEDVKGEVNVTYYPDREYFMIESDIEKIFYGSYGNTGTTLYELSYENWGGTGNEVKSLKKIPVAWFIAERHSKVDGRSIYYHYENIEEQHRLNPKVSYTSEIMLKKISDGNEVNIDFEYGVKADSENEELKLKDDEGNLRMGNFLIEKHFLTGIKVETENYEQNFGINCDLFDGKLRILKSITQVLDNGINDMLKFNNKKIFEPYLPTEIEIFHGPTTKLTYNNQVIPMPQLEKKFLLKNGPVVAYGTDNMLFSSIIDNRIEMKIFNIKTFKLIKEFTIFNQKAIKENSLQTNYGHNFFVAAYKTDESNYIKIYHQNEQKKWNETPTVLSVNKDSMVYTTSHGLIVVQDKNDLIIIEKNWNDNNWQKHTFRTNDPNMKILTKGKSIFVRNGSNLHVIFKNENQKWKMKLIKNGIYQTADSFANVFNASDEIKNFIRNSLENNEIKVLDNVVVLSNLNILSNGQLTTNFNFITLNDKYEIIHTDQFVENHENIYDISKTFETEGTSVKVKYRLIDSKYEIMVVEMFGKIDEQIRKTAGRNRNKQADAKADIIKGYNDDSVFKTSMKSQFLLNWKEYYPLTESGSNELYFGENIQFRMTGDKWTKLYSKRKRELKLGEYFKLVFNKDIPEIVKLISQKDDSVEIDIRLYQSHKLLNFYPHYIAYQSDESITKLIIFDDGKSIVKHETFRKEKLMMESNPGYFMTIKKSEDVSHSEPYELILRNIVHFIEEKPQPVVGTVEVSSDASVNTLYGKYNKRITKYDRIFKVDKKLWTSTVKVMNGATKSDNGWIEHFVTRNDEADIEQTTSYYDSDKNLIKSEVKTDEPEEIKDYSDSLLYDVTATLQISNFLPYKKSEDAFGYYGFEDYEDNHGWNFKSEKVVKNGFALTGNNFLQLGKDDTFQKSFIPKNKREIFIAAAWIRSSTLQVGEILENFKALISFSVDGSNFTELFGILGNVKQRNGEWFNVEVSIDFLNTIRTSYERYRIKNPESLEFDSIKFKVTLSVSRTENSQLDVDNIAFYPAPHNLEVNVYNKNNDLTSIIRSDGQIARNFYDGMNFKLIGRTKKNGDLDKFIIHKNADQNSPKIVTKFSVDSGFYENFDKISFTNRWKMSNVQNWKVLPSELIHTNENSNDWLKLRNKSLMDSSAALRTEISLDSKKNSTFEIKFKTDSIKFESNVSDNITELKVNGSKVIAVPKYFELAVYKLQKRTIIWIDGVVEFDQILSDTWKDFILQFSGKVSLKNSFILNNPKVEIFYHNTFNEKEQEIKLESDNSVIVTQYIHDEFGREKVTSKATRITQKSTEPLLKYYKNFITSFDPVLGKMEGDVITNNPNDQGFPYYHIIYLKDPMNEKHKIGFPGREFSLQSNFLATYERKINSPFINAYFPDDSGFTKSIENLANGSKRIIVYDKAGNKVAKYVQVPNFDDALMTYEYDNEGRINKVLSPKYHDSVKTVLKINEIWMPGEAHLSDEEKELQDKLGIHFKYDKRGNMIEKRTPDVGRQVFLYNSMSLLKFSITFNADPKDGKTIYYNYDSAGGLTETGQITKPVSVDYLKNFVDSNFHTQAIEFQKIQFNDKNSKIIETINHDTTVLEEIQFDDNEEDKIISRKLTVPALTESLLSTFNVQRNFIGDHVNVLTYPETDEGKILKVQHTYNGVGQLIGIGTVEKPFNFAKFIYDANGQPSSEVHELNNLNRNYCYTSTGYMNKIEDEFLTEEISYIDGGYGQLGYGDGIVMKTAFDAKWSNDFFEKSGDSNNKSHDEYLDFNYDDGVFEEEIEGSELRRTKRDKALKLLNSRKTRSKKRTRSTNSNFGKKYKLQNNQKITSNLGKTLEKLERFSKDNQDFKNKTGHNTKQLYADNTIRCRRSTFLSRNPLKTSRKTKLDQILSNFDEDSCISALSNSNFLSESSQKFKKILNTQKEVNLPLKCYDDNIYSEISARNQIPKYYGHRYTYGTHRELVKAKYFSIKDEEEAEPLQMNTFYDKIPGIAYYKSHRIFNILREGKFIAVDQRRDEKISSIGTRGTESLLRNDDLIALLQKLSKNYDYDFTELLIVIKQLILQTIEMKKVLKFQDFENHFLNWKSAGSGTFRAQLEKYKLQAKKLFDGLIQQKLIPTSTSTFITPINKKLTKELNSFTEQQIVEIVATLSKSFSNQLLTTAFDTASFEIDANGNHKTFTTGFESVKLNYHENTSKLKSLNLKGQQFTVDHDGYGNMTSAPYKGVKKIIYHPVSRRVMEVLMTNGGSIKFHYNSQGERILKQVYDSKYEITKEILYIRDEDGNVLMDRVMNFSQKDKSCFQVVTHYIYGPRGMIGFIRDEKFHSIFTDHSGSVKLIVRDGKVVASYDYLPYGEMMRKFVFDDAANIRYLYHGKELDDEFDTYNFHARFYDPTIGRFLQTDPQSQYFSPYKFSGNSPVSFVDPDGELVLLIAVIVFGIAGAYLGAAAHNNRSNPLKWDFWDPGTYVNFSLGALNGILLPIGVVQTVGTVTVISIIKVVSTMATISYLFAAASNENFNPVKWNFNPETFNALFCGAAAGATLLKDVKDLWKFATKLSTKGKLILFVFVGTTTYISVAAANENKVKFWEWDLKKLNTCKGIFDGLTYSLSLVKNAVDLKRNTGSLGKVDQLGTSTSEKLKKILLDPNNRFFKFLLVLAAGYIIANKYYDAFNSINWINNDGFYSNTFKNVITTEQWALKISFLKTNVINPKESKEWNQFFSTRHRILDRFSKFRQNAIKSKQLNSNSLKSYRHRIESVENQLLKEDKNIQKNFEEQNYVWLDRSTESLLQCKEYETSNNRYCHIIRPRWNDFKRKFKERHIDELFENIAFIINTQRISLRGYGYVTIMEPNEDLNQVSHSSILISNEPRQQSEQGMQLKTGVKIAITTQNEVDLNPLIVTDQSQDTTIYVKYMEDKIEIYHQQQDPETKVAIVVKNYKISFYDTTKKEVIKELLGVEVAKLFDIKRNEIEKTHGIVKIPEDGVVQFILKGEFKKLKSINGMPIQEVVEANKLNRRKNAEKLEKKLPDFNDNCDTCKAIYWNDLLPAGVPDYLYNFNENKELKATNVIYKDDHNNWKLISQLIEVDAKNAGKPEIAEIRPTPKLFDLKVNVEKDDDSTSRKRRDIPVFFNNNPKNQHKNYINNSTSNFNQSSPSILTLGDFCLNATDFNSNLTLAYAFLKKWTNETLFSTNEENMPKITDIEFEIFANDLTNEFTENIFELSIKCGIPTVMRDILNDLDLQKISNEVKRKIEKNLIKEIPKYLMREILEKNEGKVVKKSSKKQFKKLREMVFESQNKFLESLLKRNEKLYMKN